MQNITSNLVFPSGLSVSRARQRAKASVKSEQFANLAAALDHIAIQEMNLPWALAMPRLEQFGRANSTLITLADIAQVMQDYPLLEYGGFGHDDCYYEAFYQRHTRQSKAEYLNRFRIGRQRLGQALDECQRCCLYLEHMRKIKARRYNLSSYGLKHSVERYHRALHEAGQQSVEHGYVSNGAMICAAIHMGFEVIRYDDHSPNAAICASMQSDIVIWEKLLNRQGSLRPLAEQRLFAQVTKNIGLGNTLREPSHSIFL